MPLLTPEHIAKTFRVTVEDVQCLIDSGELTAFHSEKLGWIIDEKGLEAFRDFRSNQPKQLVYFLEAVGVNRLKIGWSTKLKKRISELQVASPVKLVHLHSERGGLKREKQLHERFAADWCHGEWFVFSDTIRNYIASATAQKTEAA